MNNNNSNPLVATVEFRPQDQISTAAATNNSGNNNSAENLEKTPEGAAPQPISRRYPILPAPTQVPFVAPAGAEIQQQQPTNSSVMEAARAAAATIKSNQVAHQKQRAAGGYKSKRVFKVIIIGDAGVGKTCLSYRFCNGRFPGPTEATIGVDFRERSLIIDDEMIRVQLWDTAGQERYRQSIVAHYYRNVNAVVFVYDVNNLSSFKSLPVWIAECKKHALTSGDDTPHVLIGNKCDLPLNGGERVKTEQAQIFSDENDMALFETSALADSESDHIESIFMTLVHKLRQSKPMHVQSSEERTQRDQQKILLKANELRAAGDGEEEDEAGMCC